MTNKHSATHNLIPAPYDTNGLSASIYDYKKQARKRLLLLAGLSALVIIAFLMDLYIGSQGLSYETFMQGLFHSEIAPGEINKRAVVIVWDIRMPSAIMALLIGMILAVSGAPVEIDRDHCVALARDHFRVPPARPPIIERSLRSAMDIEDCGHGTVTPFQLGDLAPHGVAIGPGKTETRGFYRCALAHQRSRDIGERFALIPIA